MKQKVIDVSYHNGIIDWQKVKDAGYHAILRCGYGQDQAGQDDKQWARNYSECERLGIPYGAYFYSYAKSTSAIQGEIDHCLRLIQGRKLSYPVYFDSEEPGTQNVAKANAESFGAAMEAAGFWAGVYASDSWWKSYLQGLDRFTKWVARYSSKQPETACDIWQYSSDGSVPGVNGRCDVNLCYRDLPAEIGGAASASGEAKTTPQAASQPAQAGFHVNLQAQVVDGRVLPAVRDDNDDAGIDSAPIAYLAAWGEGFDLLCKVADETGRTYAQLTNPSNINDHVSGCCGNGRALTKIWMDSRFPNADHRIWYRVKTRKSGWLSWMKDGIDTGGSSDTFAGDGSAILRVEAHVGGL